MKKKILLLIVFIGMCHCGYSKIKEKIKSDRQYWYEIMYKISAPILREMSEGNLQKKMKVEVSPSWDNRDIRVAYMEAFGRTMAGIAPWLSLPDDDTEEGKMRKQLREWALKSYVNAVNPESSDYLLWRNEGQPLVDAAYIAESFLRGYDSLWLPLDDVTKQRYISEFQQLRRINPPYSNWLLFSSTVECFLRKAGAQYDDYRISSALRKIEEWYIGDGWYSDGPHFSFDYYNGYVIHPMYWECIGVITNEGKNNTGICRKERYDEVLTRMQRFGTILERLISPEGSFPAFGRSIPYRLAAFQPLSLLALNKKLPGELTEGQVRAGLTAVLKRMFTEKLNNFNDKGYLTIGFGGNQPNISDYYTNNGSLYITSLFFLPLGLSANDSFWTTNAEEWTNKKAWSNKDFPKDHSWK